MAEILSVLRGYELPVLVVLLLFAVLLGVFLYRRLSRITPEQVRPALISIEEDARLAGRPELSPALMRTAFRNGLRIYQDQVAGLRNPYLVPWFLAVAAESSGLTTLCASGQPAHPPAETIDPATRRPVGVTWWFHDQAVVLEVASDAFVREDGARVADAAWTTLLEELSAKRSALPLDGIVLAISASDFGGPDAPPRQQLVGKAMRIYSRLWQAQRALGISLPVWVVLTRCDIIPGFRALAEALPESRRGQAVGWSSAYALESAFQPEWIAEAIDSVQDCLVAAGLELAAMAPGSPAACATLELPREMDLLREPLSIFLSNVFRRTPFQESLFFRGIWLTGSAGAPFAAAAEHGRGMAPGLAPDLAPSLAPLRHAASLAFARDLFVHKIFAERDLPRAAPRWATGTARAQLAWRIGTGAAAALAGWLLWSGAEQLDTLRTTFVPALKALEEPVRLTRQAERGPANPVSGEMFGAAQAIRAVSRIDVDWATPWFPAAWVDSLHERVSVALAVAHYRLMMADIRSRLQQRATAVASPEHDQTDGPARGALARIRHFVGEVLLLESYVEVFNRLQAAGGTDGLAELLRFTHGVRLPATYVAVAEELDFTRVPSNRVLRQATLGDGAVPLDYAMLRDPLELRLRDLSREYFRAATQGIGVSADLALTAARIDLLADPASARTALPPLLPAIAEGLTRVSAQLAAGDGLWPGRTDAGLGPPAYRDLLGLVTKSPLLGPTVRDALVSDARAIVGDADAAAFPSAMIGPLVSPSTVIGPLVFPSGAIGPLVLPAPGRNRLDLSPPALALQTGLTTLIGRPFMHPAASPPDLRPGLVRWDIHQLEQAVAMTGDYALLLARDLPALPEAARPGIRAIARDRLLSSVFDAVAQAQLGLPPDTPGGARGPELKAMAASSVAAAPLFRRLADALRQANDPAAADRLTNALMSQSVAVLDRATVLLDAQPAYQPPDGNLSDWFMTGVDVARLYGQIDLASVGALLDQQRAEIALLLRDVTNPELSVLGGPNMPNAKGKASVRLWSDIAADLDEAGQKRPAGSLAALEKFIETDLPSLKPGECPPAHAWSGSGNWFSGQLGHLRDHLARQCGLAFSTLALNAYQQVQQAFQVNLAGRYPFASSAQAHPAHAQDIAAFYRIFDAQGGGAGAGLGETLAAITPAQPEPARFIATMQRLRPALAAVAGLDGGDGLVRLETRFRPLPAREAGADEVIEARLQVGGIASDDAKHRPVVWRLGDPIQIAFRWALNAPHLPVTIKDAPHATTQGGLTTASYDDPWALVTLIRSQRPSPADWVPDGERGRDMLAFDIPTTLADGKPALDQAARLFIELTLRPPPGARPAAASGAAEPLADHLELNDIPTEAPPVSIAQPAAVRATPGVRGTPGIRSRPAPPGALREPHPDRPPAGAAARGLVAR